MPKNKNNKKSDTSKTNRKPLPQSNISSKRKEIFDLSKTRKDNLSN